MSYSLENLTGQFFCIHLALESRQMVRDLVNYAHFFTHQVTTIKHAMETLEQI